MATLRLSKTSCWYLMNAVRGFSVLIVWLLLPMTWVVIGPAPASSAENQEADPRLPIPDEAERDDRRNQVAELFPVDNVRTFDEKSDLAKVLLETGQGSGNDRPAQFALYQMAREIAADAGNTTLALNAVAELEKTFQVDAGLRIETITKLAEASSPVSERKQAIRHGLGLIDQLLEADEYHDAGRLVVGLSSVARELRDLEAISELKQRRELGRTLYIGYQATREAIERLKEDPNDAAASLTAGEFYTFTKGDWQRGLPLLAAGSDEILSNLAQQEIAVPKDPLECKEIADAWLELGNATDGIAGERQLARAAMWYARIGDSLRGLAKVEVARRIEQIGELPFDGGTVYGETQPAVNVAAATVPSDAEPMTEETGAVGKSDDKVLSTKGKVVCKVLQGKKSPEGLIEGAVPFRGPPGDGRSGANGIVIESKGEWMKRGTVWVCNYQRSGSAEGIQFIHPLGEGHVIVTVTRRSVAAGTVRRWPDPSLGYTRTHGKIEVAKSSDFEQVFDLKETPRQVMSRVAANGTFGCFIDGKLMAVGKFANSFPLDLTPNFTGERFDPQLRPGQGAVIIGPLDNGINRAEDLAFGVPEQQ